MEKININNEEIINIVEKFRIYRSYKIISASAKECLFFYALDKILKKCNKDDDRIVEYGKRRIELIKRIESDGILELKKDSYDSNIGLVSTFTTKTNYRYNRESKKIDFDKISIIERFDYGFEISPYLKRGTVLYQRYEKELNELLKIDGEINKIYHEYKNLVDNIIEDNKAYLTNDYSSMIILKYFSAFKLLYGEEGICNAIKWLNRINEEDNLDLLAEEFIIEMDELKNKGYDIENYEKLLLKTIKYYSPRANLLSKRIYFKRTGEEQIGVNNSTINFK